MISPTPGVWVAILLMMLLIGSEVVRQFNPIENGRSLLQKLAYSFVASDRGESYRQTRVDHAPKIIVRVDSIVLLDHLADALGIIDRAVAEAKGEEKPASAAQLEELPELLDFLQDLLGDAILEDAQGTFKRAKVLPAILMNQGIQVVTYRPDGEPSSRRYFDFEPSLDRSLKDYITLTPAFLKGDRVLRRGRVLEPSLPNQDKR